MQAVKHTSKIYIKIFYHIWKNCWPYYSVAVNPRDLLLSRTWHKLNQLSWKLHLQSLWKLLKKMFIDIYACSIWLDVLAYSNKRHLSFYAIQHILNTVNGFTFQIKIQLNSSFIMYLWRPNWTTGLKLVDCYWLLEGERERREICRERETDRQTDRQSKTCQEWQGERQLDKCRDKCQNKDI